MERKKRVPHSVDTLVIKEKSEQHGEDSGKVFSFATRFNSLLESRGIDQITIAHDLKIGEGTISNYRNGVQKPGFANIVKIANYLDVDCHYLCTGVSASNRSIAEYTGLSEKAIERLHGFHQFEDRGIHANLVAAVNALLEDDETQAGNAALWYIAQYLKGFDSFAWKNEKQLADTENTSDTVFMCVDGKPEIEMPIANMDAVFLTLIQNRLKELKDALKNGGNNGKH